MRARLTATLLTVVVGPVLVGAGLVSIVVGTIYRSSSLDRLDVAATALATSVGATCDRLQAAADVAARSASGTPPDPDVQGGDRNAAATANQVVAAGRASAVRFATTGGMTTLATVVGPPLPWALCGPQVGVPEPRISVPVPIKGLQAASAIAAAAPMLSPNGATVGYAYAAQGLDASYVRGLSDDVGAGVTLVGDPVASTEPPHVAQAVAASRATGTSTTADRYVRHVSPISGVPIEFAVSVPEHGLSGLVALTAAAVLLAATLAIVTARSLARGLTRRADPETIAADGLVDTAIVAPGADGGVEHSGAVNRRPSDATPVDTLAAGRDRVRGHLDVLGQTLSSTHDLPRILRVILDAAIAATGAERGAVFLIDDANGGRGRLSVACSDGLEVFDETSWPRPFSAGLLGSVAATGIARRGRASTLDGDVGDAGNTHGAYLAVPMQLPVRDGAIERPSPTPGAANIRGVLALCDRIGGADFDEDDLRMVRTFAGHAAVAVDNVRLHDEARRLSHTDPLTGLDNYRHLQELLMREINRSARFGHSLCVMVLDLDHFKNGNDTYGHGAGDSVLTEFARRIRSEIRGVDLAFRAGGEEFVLLLPET